MNNKLQTLANIAGIEGKIKRAIFSALLSVLVFYFSILAIAKGERGLIVSFCFGFRGVKFNYFLVEVPHDKQG